jgi:hypothetical protein
MHTQEQVALANRIIAKIQKKTIRAIENGYVPGNFHATELNLLVAEVAGKVAEPSFRVLATNDRRYKGYYKWFRETPRSILRRI